MVVLRLAYFRTASRKSILPCVLRMLVSRFVSWRCALARVVHYHVLNCPMGYGSRSRRRKDAYGSPRADHALRENAVRDGYSHRLVNDLVIRAGGCESWLLSIEFAARS